MLTFFKNYHNTKYQTNNSYKQISIINFFANPLFHTGSTEFFYAYADDYHYSLVNEFLKTQNNYKEELTKIEEILLNNQINVNDTWYIDIINYEQKRSIQGNLDVSKIFINYKEEFVPSSALDFTFEVKNVLHAYEYCYVRALLINTKLTGSFMNYFVAVAKLANNTSLLMGNSLILVAALPKKEITVGAAPRINPENPSPLFFQANHYVFEHKNMFSTFSHPFHIVDPSPWPFCTSMGLWYLTITTVAFFHNFLSSIFNIVFGIFYLCICLGFWWRDVIYESIYEFKHTPYVRRGLLTGMLLFIMGYCINKLLQDFSIFNLKIIIEIQLVFLYIPIKLVLSTILCFLIKKFFVSLVETNFLIFLELANHILKVLFFYNVCALIFQVGGGIYLLTGLDYLYFYPEADDSINLKKNSIVVIINKEDNIVDSHVPQNVIKPPVNDTYSSYFAAIVNTPYELAKVVENSKDVVEISKVAVENVNTAAIDVSSNITDFKEDASYGVRIFNQTVGATIGAGVGLAGLYKFNAVTYKAPIFIKVGGTLTSAILGMAIAYSAKARPPGGNSGASLVKAKPTLKQTAKKIDDVTHEYICLFLIITGYGCLLFFIIVLGHYILLVFTNFIFDFINAIFAFINGIFAFIKANYLINDNAMLLFNFFLFKKPNLFLYLVIISLPIIYIIFYMSLDYYAISEQLNLSNKSYSYIDELDTIFNQADLFSCEVAYWVYLLFMMIYILLFVFFFYIQITELDSTLLYQGVFIYKNKTLSDLKNMVFNYLKFGLLQITLILILIYIDTNTINMEYLIAIPIFCINGICCAQSFIILFIILFYGYLFYFYINKRFSQLILLKKLVNIFVKLLLFFFFLLFYWVGCLI